MGRAPWWLPCAVYGPLAALGAGWSWLSRGSVLSAPPAPRFTDEPLSAALIGIALALLVTALTVLATRWLVAKTRWARALHATFRGALYGATSSRLLLLALSSAVAEELFFRAALLPSLARGTARSDPWLGLFASALIFGFVHISRGETYLGWALWASLMGIVFGLLFLASGSLLAPIVAHAAINYENMQYVCSYDPTVADSGRSSAQGAPFRRL